MRLIDQQSAEPYLRATGRVSADEPVQVRELSGGVSNMVFMVERPQHPGEEFVLKQALAQLRTAQPWFANIERIWREAEVLSLCTQLLDTASARSGSAPLARTPRILFEDRENYLFAMTAAARPNTVWKQDLLSGQVNPQIALACGRLLGTLHAESWRDHSIERQLGDRTLFHELRVDPFYRTLAVNCPEARPAIESLIASLALHPCCLVHADFSPKNLLVFEGGLMMVDFETGHYGDPAFDLGFFLSHLVLKACRAIPDHAAYLHLSEEFARAYDEVMAPKVGARELALLWARGILNFAACAWARLDGKSPVDYLDAPAKREQIRRLCREVFHQEPSDWPAVIALAQSHFGAVAGPA